MKIRNGETKYLFKRAALRYFPAEMVCRPMEGFLMPVTQWMSNDLQPYVRETLRPSGLSQHGFFRQERVDALIDRVSQPRADHTHVNKAGACRVPGMVRDVLRVTRTAYGMDR